MFLEASYMRVPLLGGPDTLPSCRRLSCSEYSLLPICAILEVDLPIRLKDSNARRHEYACIPETDTLRWRVYTELVRSILRVDVFANSQSAGCVLIESGCDPGPHGCEPAPSRVSKRLFKPRPTTPISSGSRAPKANSSCPAQRQPANNVSQSVSRAKNNA